MPIYACELSRILLKSYGGSIKPNRPPHNFRTLPLKHLSGQSKLTTDALVTLPKVGLAN
jgi:hypothetical protein